MKRNSGIIGPISTVAKATPENAKMFDLHDQHIKKLSDSWPNTKKILNVTKGTTVWDQNTTYTVTVTGEGWDAGSETLYYVINPIGAPTSIFNGTTGSFTMSTSNTGSFNQNIRFSGYPEFTDITRDFTIQIRENNVSGPILFETPVQTIAGFSMTNAGFNVTSSNEILTRYIYTRYSGIGSGSYNHRFYYRYLGYTGKSNAELIQGIGLSGSTTQYEGRTLNKTAGSTGYLEFTVRGFGSASIIFSISVDGDTNCVTRIKKNGTTAYSVTGSGTQTGSIGGCTNGDVIRVEYEKPSGAGSVGNDEGRINYMYVSGFSTAFGVANDTTGDVTGLLSEGVNYTHNMGTSLFSDAFVITGDYTAEGSETMYVQAVSFGYGAGGSAYYQVYEDSMTINDTSVTPVVSISESTTTITENDGVGVTFTVTDTAHTVSDTYYYSVSGTGITAADFSDNTLTGSISMSPGGGGIQGTVNKQAVAENVTEGESFTLDVRTGSTSGTVRATSSSISIVDASLPNFPVAGADVQWEFHAHSAPSSMSAGTYYQFPQQFAGYSLTTDMWKSDFTATRTSYTNSSGATRYYLSIPADADFTTQTNTSDGPTCITNGGYTIWLAWVPLWSGTSWGRPWNYWGFASGSSTFNSSQPSSTSQYHGPLMFVNGSRTDTQYRRPSPTTSNGDYAYTASGTNTTGSNNISIFIITQYTTGAADYRVWNGNRTTGVGTYYGNTSFSFTGSAGTGIKNTVNAARPFFADSTYFGTAVSPLRLMTAGFINEPFNSTDQLTLLNYFKGIYA